MTHLIESPLTPMHPVEEPMDDEALHNPQSISGKLPEVQTSLQQLTESAEARRTGEEPSDWYVQQKGELDAFQESGYSDLSVLHVDEAPQPEIDAPHKQRRLIPSLGQAGLGRWHGQRHAEAFTEDQPVITESTMESGLTLRSYQYADREVLELLPDNVREDPSTGEPVAPLLFVQGIGGGSDLLTQDLAHFARSGNRAAYGVRLLGKHAGTSAKLVDVGLPDRVPLNYYQQSQTMLKSLAPLGIKKVDLVAVSEGAIPAVIARNELVANPELPEIGDTILVHPQGLDDRSYIARHRGGARLIRQTVKMNRQDPESRAQAKGDWSDGQSFRQINARRKGSARADVRQTLADTPLDQDAQTVTIIGGKHDPAIPAAMLKEQIIDPDHVTFIESDWGGVGHGFGPDRKTAIEQVSDILLAQEQLRQLAHEH